MNKRLTSSAIVMALIITLSSFTALAATTKVAAEMPTTTAIRTMGTGPLVDQKVPFTVNLMSGRDVLSQPVKIWHTLNGVRYEDGTHSTINGVYGFTQAFNPSGQRVYHAEFAGDSQYAASSGTVTVNVRTTPIIGTNTALTSTTTTPTVNQQVTFTARLVTSGTATPSGKPVTIYHYLNGVRYNDLTAITNADGKISVTQSFGSTGVRSYYATYAGDSTYTPSTSSVVSIYVGVPVPLSAFHAITP